jgi:hypothetical protein
VRSNVAVVTLVGFAGFVGPIVVVGAVVSYVKARDAVHEDVFPAASVSIACHQ